MQRKLADMFCLLSVPKRLVLEKNYNLHCPFKLNYYLWWRLRFLVPRTARGASPPLHRKGTETEPFLFYFYISFLSQNENSILAVIALFFLTTCIILRVGKDLKKYS